MRKTVIMMGVAVLAVLLFTATGYAASLDVEIKTKVAGCCGKDNAECSSGWTVLGGGILANNPCACGAQDATIDWIVSERNGTKKWRCGAYEHKATCYAVCGKWD